MSDRAHELCFHQEQFHGIHRVQVGEFGEVLSLVEARFLAALSFHLLRDSAATGATLALDVPRRDVAEMASLFRSLGSAVVLGSEDRSLLGRLGFGSRAMVAESLAEPALASALLRAWFYSPLAWGVPCPKMRASLEIAEIQWLLESALPPPAVMTQWEVMMVSFFHGQWVGVCTPDRGYPRVIQAIKDTAEAIGFDVRMTRQPM